MDPGLAPVVGVDGMHRQTVGDLSAVAAPLADALVDDDSLGGSLELATLPASAPLGGALLLVDEHRHPRHLGQLALHLVEALPRAHLHALGPPVQGHARGIRVVAGHDDARNPFGEQQIDEVGEAALTDGLLATGHRDRRVAQQFEGHVATRGHRSPHGETARMRERAVTDVLQVVGLSDERGHTQPESPLTTHLRSAGHLPAVGPWGEHDQGVATDAGADQAAVRGAGRGVVRAPGTEVRRAHRKGQRRAVPAGYRVDGSGCHLDPGRLDTCSGEESAQHRGDLVGAELTHPGQQRPAGRVGLAEHDRLIRPPVERDPHLVLQEGAFVLDDEHLAQPAGEASHDLLVQRPGSPDPQHADAPTGQVVVSAHTERRKRLPHSQISRAGRDQTDRRRG